MVTINVVCYKYKQLKNNEFPLKIRVCKNRKVRYINLGVSVKLEDWDLIKNQPKSSCPNKEYINKLISRKISEIRDKIIQLKSEDEEFSATTLVEKVSNPIKFITVDGLFKIHILSLKEHRCYLFLIIFETTPDQYVIRLNTYAPSVIFFLKILHTFVL